MKIQKLEIEKIRGIKKLIIEPNQNNIVIFGPNGSGKSAVVDAIDFLLTGKISRLEGEGSDELSIKKHGPHIDHEPKEAIVKAEVKIPGVEETILLERRMSNPKEILFEEKYKNFILPLLELSDLGQHILSRREILRYVIATAGKRSEEIHAILDLTKIDKTRKLLVSVQTLAERNQESSHINLKKIITDITILLSIEEFSEKKCLDKINENRAILKAVNINTIDPLVLKKDIKRPTGKSENDEKNLNFLRLSIKSIKSLFNEKDKILGKIVDLKAKIQGFKEEFDAKREINYRKLVELGLSLVDRDFCPLCEKPWKAEELKEFLNKKLMESEKGKERIENIKSDVREIIDIVIKYRDNLSNLESYYKTLGFDTYQNNINSSIKELTDFINNFSNPIENKIEEESIIINIIENRKYEELVEKIDNEISGIKYEVSLELNSWDILTNLEVLLKQYKNSEKIFEKSKRILNHANLLLLYFETSRDDILNNIFNSINTNFINFYKELHEEDEKDFKSSLKPKEAKLIFDVDFYGRGMYPPAAMHSEGHQDSMGVCLFLSLHKFLAENKLNLIVLDDVVMSVDSEHRRKFCKILSTYFPDKQFIITTHDRVWANQLRTEHVVNNRNMYEFKWWSIETGPTAWEGEDFWRGIEDDLINNEVTTAAWKLRRNGESFLNDVCDFLRAEIIFKSDNNWELGDYLPAAISQYNKLLKKAKEAANSWSYNIIINELKEIERKFNEVAIQTQYEQWGINPNVHYNKWVDFQTNDFKPIVDSFHKLFNFFICQECKYIPQLLLSEMKLDSLKCQCGKFFWNLRIKDK